MTKGQTEAKISHAVSRFEIEHMGRGPKQIKTLITQDLIIIRLVGFMPQWIAREYLARRGSARFRPG